MHSVRMSHSPAIELVSVIIPSHNYGMFIDETLKSIMNQTYRNIEVIIVDDGSDEEDGAGRVVAKYPSVKYFYQEHRGNLTPARAMNVGISLSHGAYIACIAADDKLSSTYIERCVSEIEKGKRVGFVWTGKQEFGASNKVYLPGKVRFKSSFYRGVGGSIGAMLVRREAYDKMPYDESLHGKEDLDLVLRLVKKGWKWRTVNAPLHFQRQHEASLTKRINPSQMRKKVPYQHELERKYPIMILFVRTDMFFKAVKLFLTKPQLLASKATILLTRS